jgi:ribose transport system permease protein
MTWLRRLGPLAAFAVVFLFFTVLVWAQNGRNTYATGANLQTLALQTAIVGTSALGMTLIIVSGGIDLSIGSIVAFSSVVVAVLLKHAQWPALPAALGGVAAGALCGLLNGALVTSLRLVPFIVTLGTMLAVRGAAKGLAGQKTVSPDPGPLDRLLEAGGFLAPGVWILLALAVATAAFLRLTRPGLHLTAVGSNEAAARLCGVPVARVKLTVYTLGGAFAGLAGLFQYSRLTLGDPTSAPGHELDVIAAVVIGGGSLAGGEGSVLGSLVGALVMTSIRAGCAQMGWPNWVTEIVFGAIIVGAVALDRWRIRLSES